MHHPSRPIANGSSLPTRNDVAKLAGVSTATVSYVVNNGPRPVSEKARLRVEAAIEQLGYQPSEVARSLRKRSTATIGLIISNIELAFFGRVVRGVQDGFASYDRSVILANTDENPAIEADYLRLMSSKRVDGLILSPTGANLELLQTIQARGIPVVLIDRQVAGLNAPFVGIDNRQAAYQAVSYLISQGHRAIGLVSGMPPISAVLARQEGYRQALAAAGIPLIDERIAIVQSPGSLQYEPASQLTQSLLQEDSDLTAFFATNADLTLGVLRGIHRAGLEYPEAISLIGFDDVEYFEAASVPITTVRQPAYDIGQCAAQLLQQLIEGKSPRSETTLLATQLMIRESVVTRPSQRPSGEG